MHVKTLIRYILVHGKRGCALSLAATYFLFQVVLGHAQESAFWANRKAAAQKLKNQTSSAPESPAQELLLAQIPSTLSAEMAGSAQNLSAELAAAFTSEKNNLPAKLQEETPGWVSNLVLPYGVIQEVSLAQKSNAPFIIHIQDVHGV